MAQRGKSRGGRGGCEEGDKADRRDLPVSGSRRGTGKVEVIGPAGLAGPGLGGGGAGRDGLAGMSARGARVTGRGGGFGLNGAKGLRAGWLGS